MVNQNNKDIEVTKGEFEELINNGHKLVVVDFFADWCMPCLMLAPIIDELSESMKEVKFAKINVDDNREIAAKFKVQSIPCLIIFKEGKEVDRIIGAQPSEAIEEKVKSYL